MWLTSILDKVEGCVVLSKRVRGFSRERELARILYKHGFAVLRAPASGAKTRRLVYPDIVAIKNGVVLVFEVKTREKPSTIYIDKRQFMKLQDFIYRSGGHGFIAVKIMDGRGWRFVPVELVEETRGGNYRVSMEAIEKGYTLRDLVKLCDKTRSLTEWLEK